MVKRKGKPAAFAYLKKKSANKLSIGVVAALADHFSISYQKAEEWTKSFLNKQGQEEKDTWDKGFLNEPKELEQADRPVSKRIVAFRARA